MSAARQFYVLWTLLSRRHRKNNGMRTIFVRRSLRRTTEQETLWLSSVRISDRAKSMSRSICDRTNGDGESKRPLWRRKSKRRGTDANGNCGVPLKDVGVESRSLSGWPKCMAERERRTTSDRKAANIRDRTQYQSTVRSQSNKSNYCVALREVFLNWRKSNLFTNVEP